MKRFFIFVGMMLATVCAQAQLRVIENGNIAVQTDTIPRSPLSFKTTGSDKTTFYCRVNERIICKKIRNGRRDIFKPLDFRCFWMEYAKQLFVLYWS